MRPQSDCGLEQQLSLTFNSCVSCVQVLNAMVEVMAGWACLPSMSTSRITLAVNELFANIVKHGYGDDAGVVEFSVRLYKSECGEPEIEFVFRDYAPTLEDVALFKLAPCQDGEKITPGGLGMHLIHCVMKNVQHEALEDGNRWRMVFNCKLEKDDKE